VLQRVQCHILFSSVRSFSLVSSSGLPRGISSPGGTSSLRLGFLELTGVCALDNLWKLYDYQRDEHNVRAPKGRFVPVQTFSARGLLQRGVQNPVLEWLQVIVRRQHYAKQTRVRESASKRLQSMIKGSHLFRKQDRAVVRAHA